MSALSRTKGANAEREVCRLLHEYGWPNAERTSNGRVQSNRGDIANGPAGTSIEVKRGETAKVWAWWMQASLDSLETGATPIVAFRRSRSQWLALIEFDELLPLLALRERGT
jgi:Holliday junction resolvase